MGEYLSPGSPADLLAGTRPATVHDVRLVRMLLETGQQLESLVSGTSMGQAIPLGSHIRIRRCNDGGTLPGRVIAFLAGGRIVVHRVVHAGRRGAARDFVVTRGDADWLCDLPVHVDLIAGCVTETSAGGDWHAVEPAQAPLRERLLASIAQAVLCLTLEVNPRLAVFVGRSMFGIRSRVRRLIRRTRTDNSRHVRT